MKLTNLDPVWLTEDLFIFRNPTGGADWLSCARVSLTRRKQMKIFQNYNHIRGTAITIVGIKDGYAWEFKGNDFATLTVTPSIDASASGNWHGHITNGAIT